MSLQLACLVTLCAREVTLVLSCSILLKVPVALLVSAAALVMCTARGRQLTAYLLPRAIRFDAGRRLFATTCSSAAPFVLPWFIRLTWLPGPTRNETPLKRA